jgi:hypothetical protein
LFALFREKKGPEEKKQKEAKKRMTAPFLSLSLPFPSSLSLDLESTG